VVNGFENKLIHLLGELNSWDMLYLNGTSHLSKKEFGKWFYVVRKMSGAFGYVVNSRFYDKLIEVLSGDKKLPDLYYMDLQPHHECYLSKEKLVRHLDGYSVRTEKIVVYPHLR